VPRNILVALGLGALALAALAGVERIAGRHPNADVPEHATSTPEPALPSAAEAGDLEPSASPVLTH
jgi:hypothetical protein